MQITANTGQPWFDHSFGVSVQSIQSAHTAMVTAVPQPYLPSEPHVLTDDLKAQLAAANQQRREHLYPRLAQTLATIEPSNITRSYSQQRAMSLQELAAANKARRSKLRETGAAVPAAAMT